MVYSSKWRGRKHDYKPWDGLLGTAIMTKTRLLFIKCDSTFSAKLYEEVHIFGEFSSGIALDCIVDCRSRSHRLEEFRNHSWSTRLTEILYGEGEAGFFFFGAEKKTSVLLVHSL